MDVFRNIIFPGRHHLFANWQEDYFAAIRNNGGVVSDLHGQSLRIENPARLIIAITSGNTSRTRRNPVAGERRLAMAEAFAESLAAAGYEGLAYLIDDIPPTDRFADYVVKDIVSQSRNRLPLSPQNSVIACSTPAVNAMYEKLGYRILPLELGEEQAGRKVERPWDLVLRIAQSGAAWAYDRAFRASVHPTSQKTYEKYRLGDDIRNLYANPLFSADGELTSTRNFRTYAVEFDDGARRKYGLVRQHVQPGQILDLGCASGGIIGEMSEDPLLRESDLYGIDGSARLLAYARQRQSNGDFSNPNVFLFQGDVLEHLFESERFDTITSFSLTHEIGAYAGYEKIEVFLRTVFDQLKPGGVYLNYDPVGPADKDRKVFLWLNQENGAEDDGRDLTTLSNQEAADYVRGLSDLGRFERFAHDFRRTEEEQFQYELQKREPNRVYAVLSLAQAVEFLSKKEYADNWLSEMHEPFCRFSPEEWAFLLRKVGFEVLEGTRTLRNPWMEEHWWNGRAELFSEEDRQMVKLDYPDPVMVMVARKPR